MRLGRLVLIAFLTIPGMGAQARKIAPIPSLGQLEAASTLVCNGQVIDTALTGPDLISVYKGGVPAGYEETWMTAHVRVLHVFKGAAATLMVVRYRVPRPNAFLGDPPIHLQLAAGERYRFFLKPAATAGQFVSVLDGTIDDDFSLQTLCDDEADDSGPMSDPQAIRAATRYLVRQRSAFAIDSRLVSVWPEPGGLEVEVTFDASQNRGARQAVVWVMRDGKVDENHSKLDQTL